MKMANGASTKSFLVLVLAAALLSNAIVVPVLGHPRHDCPTPSGGSPPSHSGSGGYYGPTPPSHSGGGSYTPPSHSGGGGSYSPPSHGGSGSGSTPSTPSHGGGYYAPPGGSGSGSTPSSPSHGGGYYAPPGGSGSGSTPSTPSHGGGYYAPPGGSVNPPSTPSPVTPTPVTPTLPTPTPYTPTPYTPTPYVPTPSTPSIPGTPFTPPFDPNTHPISGPCDFWRTHPTLIWGVLGYWGTLGGLFGPTCTSFFGNPTLPQALSSTRQDGYGALLREGAAAYLNSVANARFPFSTQMVRDGFTSGLASDRAAFDQAQRFRLANEAH